MRKFCQMNGCNHPLAGRKYEFPLGGGFRLAWVYVTVFLAWVQLGSAQTFRLGSMDFDLIGRAEVGYESNVDDIYPDEEEPGLKKGDFYWMPGLALRSRPLAMRPSTMLNLAASYDYQDYFVRQDLDTEIYSAAIDFQTVHPRLTLGGMAGVGFGIWHLAFGIVPFAICQLDTDNAT